MSKFEPQVGEEFPLSEGEPGHRHHRRHHGRHHHHMHRHHGHHHHRRHGFGRLPALLIVAGLIALAVNHQLTASIAYGMIGAGAGLLAVMFLIHAIWHWRHRRGLHSTPSQVA